MFFLLSARPRCSLSSPCIRQSLLHCLVCLKSSGFGLWEMTSWKIGVFSVDFMDIHTFSTSRWTLDPVLLATRSTGKLVVRDTTSLCFRMQHIAWFMVHAFRQYTEVQFHIFLRRKWTLLTLAFQRSKTRSCPLSLTVTCSSFACGVQDCEYSWKCFGNCSRIHHFLVDSGYMLVSVYRGLGFRRVSSSGGSGKKFSLFSG